MIIHESEKVVGSKPTGTTFVFAFGMVLSFRASGFASCSRRFVGPCIPLCVSCNDIGCKIGGEAMQHRDLLAG